MHRHPNAASRRWRLARLAALSLALAGCAMAADEMKANGRPIGLQIVIDGDASPRVGDLARVHAAVDRGQYYVTGHAWTVTAPAGVAAPFEQTATDDSRISFALAERGTYRISCEATVDGAPPLRASASLSVRGAAGAQLVYTARIYPPPETGAPPSEQDVVVEDADQQGLIWTLDDGIEVTIEVADEDDGALLPSFVRLTTRDAPGLPLDLYLAAGRGTVALSGAFDALFVPDGDSVAPAVLADVRAALVAPRWPVALDRGIAVAGSVAGVAGALPGTVVVVHTRDARTAIDVPSTVATSGEDGAFSVRGRPGAARVTFVPPASTPYPVAVVEGEGLALAAAVSGWRFTFDAVKLAQLSATVLRADGLTPAAGATVLLQSGPLPAVGTLASASGESWPAVGQVRRVLGTDSAGRVVDLASAAPQPLPAGPYELTVIPAAAATDDGRKTVTLQLDDDQHLELRLAARGQISGTVQAPSGEALRARVTARGPSGELSVETDEQGRFFLSVDDGMAYSLVVRALVGDAAASQVGPLLMANLQVSGTTELGKLILPRAVSLAGRVITKGGLAIDGALIRIWCSGSACTSPDTVDEVLSAADGSFSVRVPPP